MTGTIPPQLENLTSLLELYLSRNELIGCIPQGLRDIGINDLHRVGLPFCDVVLSSLTVTPGSLNPPFDPFETGYTVDVYQPRITVIPTNAHGAKIEFLDAGYGPVSDIDDSLDGLQIDVMANITVIKFAVTSQDEEAAHAYVLDVRRPDLNTAPAFFDGEGNAITDTERSVAENTPARRRIGEPVAATDAEDDSLTYTLNGTDSEAFSIVPSTGQLVTKAPLNYETKAEYTVEVSVQDPFDIGTTITVTILVTDVTTGSAVGDRYDLDENGVIDREEVIAAITDYFDGLLTREEVITIISLYFLGASSNSDATGTNDAAAAAETTKADGANKTGKRSEDIVVKHRKR